MTHSFFIREPLRFKAATPWQHCCFKLQVRLIFLGEMRDGKKFCMGTMCGCTWRKVMAVPPSCRKRAKAWPSTPAFRAISQPCAFMSLACCENWCETFKRPKVWSKWRIFLVAFRGSPKHGPQPVHCSFSDSCAMASLSRAVKTILLPSDLVQQLW